MYVTFPDKSMRACEKMLRLNGVTKKFGGLIAVNDVSMTVDKGQIFGVIGPNGAGKTTLLNLISGIYRCDC